MEIKIFTCLSVFHNLEDFRDSRDLISSDIPPPTEVYDNTLILSYV